GRAAARSRLHRYFPRAAASARAALARLSPGVVDPRRGAGIVHDDLAGALAALPADVSLRRGETAERRSQLAQSHRTQLSLLDAAASHARRLVRRATAGVV